ncbi:MAG TPA: M4 family metallopeptidase [Candidatus Hydrogenedentes bacterium]|nr:M4 family metallopeptidase [Candidatus Hydrogenedentota bacterium]
MNNTLLTSISVLCFLSCSLFLACTAYCFPTTHDEKVVKEAKQRMLQSISSHNPRDVRTGRSKDFFEYVGCKKGTHIPVSVNKNADSAEVANAFMNQFGPAFGIWGPGIANRLNRDQIRKEGKVLRIGQSYTGIPIFGSEIVVNLSNDNGIRSAIAKVATASELSKFIQPSSIISASEAMIKVAEDLTSKGIWPQRQVGARYLQSRTMDYDSTLLVFAPTVLNLPGLPTLAWQIDLRGEIGVRYIINAENGIILSKYRLYYNIIDRRVYDNDNQDNCWLGTLIRSEGQGPSNNQAVDDAYSYLGWAYTYFYNKYGRDSFNGQGAILFVGVNYCCEVFFGSECPLRNAGFFLYSIFVFGGLALTDDVAGHEYTHGISHNICNLVYAQESGGICESLSDIFGEFIDLENDPDDLNDKWLIAEDTPGGPFRSMMTPPAYDCIDKKSDFVMDMDPHISSGISSKLCYLITDGDTFNGISVDPLSSNNLVSMNLTADLFYATMWLLPSASDFDCLYYALTQSAVDLDFTDTQKQSVEDACEAVEIIPSPGFVIKAGAAGYPLARFTPAGDLIMYTGTVHAQASQGNLASSGTEFMVKNANSNLLRLPYETGEMYIAGKLYTNASGFSDPPLALKINSGESLVAFVTGASYVDSVLEPAGAHIVPAGSLILAGNTIYKDVPND